MPEKAIDLAAAAEPITAAEVVETPDLLLARQAWLDLHARLSAYTRRRAPEAGQVAQEGRS